MTTNRILMLLKTRGPLTAKDLASHLQITSEGARLQLVKNMEEGFVKVETDVTGVGRPKQYYSLTDLGNGKFPDTHAELTVKLVDIIKTSLGENALQTVIDIYEEQGKTRYLNELTEHTALEEKIAKLAEIRTREGYMAEYTKEDNGYFFIENHCPICAVAKTCQGFCSSELNTFKYVLGDKVEISRMNHMIKGDRRCVYQIIETESDTDANAFNS
ncbi:transcriptional regulator [Pedobacter antarcticus 4BY]|uniref:Transcriptional regulator n=2 Tax=Pedobacter antarcticus TaxID=34086 RepID=A0A081PIT2_9SPHI|nr:transcriptional regulator [Pedobacter antarcticus 4BY]